MFELLQHALQRPNERCVLCIIVKLRILSCEYSLASVRELSIISLFNRIVISQVVMSSEIASVHLL